MSGRRWRAVLGLILISAAALRLFLALSSAPTDDAHITFRYARNIATGAGFVYNAGERVLGTTTPLFTLLLVPFARSGIPLDRAAAMIAVAADLAVILLLARLVRRAFDSTTGLLAALLYGLLYASALACGYGMETQLFTLCVLGAFYGFVAGRPRLAGAAVAAAILTRPEGLLLGGVIGGGWLIDFLRGARPFPWRGLALGLALLLPWCLFAALYFGSPIPNSLLAKYHQTGVGWREWGSFFAARNPLVLALWAGTCAGAAAGIAGQSRAAILFALWAVLYPLFFLVGRPPFLGVWYFPPLAPALCALSAVGCAAIARRVGLGVGHAAWIAAAAWVLVTAIAFPRVAESARWGRLLAEKVYRPLSGWVAANTSSGDLVQVSDIGYVGYLTNRRILDSSALVSPEVAAFYRAHPADRQRDVRYVLMRMPAVVVLPVGGTVVERFVEGGILASYRPVVRFTMAGAEPLSQLPSAIPAPGRGRRFAADFVALRRIDPD